MHGAWGCSQNVHSSKSLQKIAKKDSKWDRLWLLCPAITSFVLFIFCLLPIWHRPHPILTIKDSWLMAPSPFYQVFLQHVGLDQKTIPLNKRCRNKHCIHSPTYERPLEFQAGTARSWNKGRWPNLMSQLKWANIFFGNCLLRERPFSTRAASSSELALVRNTCMPVVQ